MSLRKSITGKYLIDLHLKSGGRFRMTGYTDNRATQRLEENIKALDSCRVAGERPDRELVEWLERMPNSLKSKLSKHGLVPKVSLERSKTLQAHFADFIEYQNGQSAKGVLNKDRITRFQNRITKILSECSFVYLSDIDSNILDKWITHKFSTHEYSAKTCNHYLQEFKQFCTWLVDNNRITNNPISTLKPITIDSGNTTFTRRALTLDEINRLINTTREAKTRNNLTGEARSLIYQLALLTGLRYSEITSLQRESFDFDNNTVTIKDIHAKNSKTDTLPLREELSEQLNEYFINNPALPKANAFNKMQAKGIYMLKKDLAEAGIEYITEQGHADFHSLRHTCGTMLARSGVLPQVAQKIMRHSSIDLTTNLYTHLLISDKQEAIKTLPSIVINKHRSIATGTDNTTVDVFSKNDQNLTKSALKGNIHTNKVGQPKVGIDFTGKKENTTNSSIDVINTRLLSQTNTSTTTATKWWRDGDSNPG